MSVRLHSAVYCCCSQQVLGMTKVMCQQGRRVCGLWVAGVVTKGALHVPFHSRLAAQATCLGNQSRKALMGIDGCCGLCNSCPGGI